MTKKTFCLLINVPGLCLSHANFHKRVRYLLFADCHQHRHRYTAYILRGGFQRSICIYTTNNPGSILAHLLRCEGVSTTSLVCSSQYLDGGCHTRPEDPESIHSRRYPYIPSRKARILVKRHCLSDNAQEQDSDLVTSSQ
jgi:hypothetical protein